MKRPDALGGLPLDHIGIAVPDLEAAFGPYRLLGLSQVGEDEVVAAQSVRVRALQVGESLLELLEPTTPESPVAAFLARRGPGLHHVALRVTDVTAEVERLSEAGARFLNTEPRPGRAGSQVVFLHPKWAGGVLVELVEHA